MSLLESGINFRTVFRSSYTLTFLLLHLLSLLQLLLLLPSPPQSGGEHDHLNDERNDEKTAGEDDDRLIGPTSDGEAGFR